MLLSEILNISKHSVVSIAGSGGKSTLMHTLAFELRAHHKVLVTTSTKIYVPNREQYDFMYIGSKHLEVLKQSKKNGVYVYGAAVSNENKLIGIHSLNDLNTFFDYILIESDGSKRKTVKGWNQTEPVILNETSVTIGVLGIDSIGLLINEDNIHRVDEFIKITDSYPNDKISVHHLFSLIVCKEGMFKNALGKKVLFINKVETDEQKKLANDLITTIKENIPNCLIDQIVIGSLKQRFYEYR